jgi:hypothetical protein
MTQYVTVYQKIFRSTCLEHEGYFSNSQCIITVDNATENDGFFYTPGDKTYEKMKEGWKYSFLT